MRSRTSKSAAGACTDYLHAPGGHDFIEAETYFTELTPDGFISWPLLRSGTVCESLETPGCFIEE